MFNKFSYTCFMLNFFLILFLVGCGGGSSTPKQSTNSPSLSNASSNLISSSLSSSSTSSNLISSNLSSSSASSNPISSSLSSSSTSSNLTKSSVSSSISNTAPTLTGIFNLEAKAGNTSIVVVNAADKENDKLQITIANKPDWLSAELNNDQVTITAKPGFFDIKDYNFTLSISDGKLSHEYPLSISVIDNPAKWVTQNISAEDLIGSWEIDEGSRLYIYPNGSGSYITSDNKLNILKWSGEGSDDISIVIPDNACRECSTSFPILSVAKKSGYLRLLINNNSIAVNAKKLSFTTPVDGTYFSLYNYPSWGVYSQLSSNGKDLLFKAGVEANFTQGSTPNYLIYALNFSAHINQSDTNSAIFNVTDETTSSIPISFKNIKTNSRDMITFKQHVISIELVPSIAKDLIVHVKSKLILGGGSENINIDDYEPQLALYLSQEQEIYHESILSTMTAPPTISVGDKYYLPNASGRWSNMIYTTPESRSTATTLVFETSSKGYVLLEGALFTATQKTPFAWSTANNTLTLTFENGLSAIDYAFALENGSLFALNKQAQTYAPAIKAASDFSGQFSAGFYFGKVALRTEYWIYQYMYFSTAPQQGIQLATITSKLGSMIYQYKIEDDSSLTFLISANCYLGFLVCEESLKAKVANNETGALLEYNNYKLIAQHDDLYTFLQTRYILRNAGNSVTQSIVNLTYDELGIQH